jgi:SP family arabinose:H+ symporter-like MFS transporter
VIISEIYPNKVRGRGMSIATTMLWIVGYAGNQMFPVMMRDMGPAGTFWSFASGALLTIVCVWLLIPETKGKSLEDITRFWTGQKTAQAEG